jgi:hypothetical protein
MSTLAELVPLLRERGYTRITVTGPQRSGTTISAAILAGELGLEAIYEERIEVDKLDKFFDLFRTKDCFVLQAPGLCSFAHALPGCIVLMRRSLDEIIRSQDRVQWGGQWERRELTKYFTNLGPVASVKYFAWDVYQKAVHKHAYDLEYDSLRGHRWWVDPENRHHFHNRQIAG